MENTIIEQIEIIKRMGTYPIKNEELAFFL
jgi:hypothetical protein